MARALLLKAGTEKRPPKGKPPGKSQGASPDDAAAVGAVAGVVSACLDRDRSAYVALADLCWRWRTSSRTGAATRRRPGGRRWRRRSAVVDRARASADAARLDDAAGGDDYRYLKLFPSRDDVLGDGGDDLAPNQGEENDVILLSLVRNDGRGANATKRDRGGATVGFLAVSNRAGDVGPALPLKPGFRDGDDAVVKVAKDRDFDGLRWGADAAAAAPGLRLSSAAPT
ncbi:Nfx1-type zinc finger-containing protein [Aureococcus anophagefferens]|nr:Nfx1-type zinc finger-containing protein [Aureococcus anophagefferens]